MKTPLLFGSPAFERGPRRVTLFNRAYLLSAEAEVVDRYDKIILTPFGEFIPFQDNFLFFLDKLVEGIGDFAPGTTPTVFSATTARLWCPDLLRGHFPGPGSPLC